VKGVFKKIKNIIKKGCKIPIPLLLDEGIVYIDIFTSRSDVKKALTDN